MGQLSVTLNWEISGEIHEDNIPKDIPDRAGIYMVICGTFSSPSGWNPNSYKLLYIGEADKIRTRIVGHEKWKCWKDGCRDSLLLKYALTEIHAEWRKRVECCLMSHARPMCNDECKEGYEYTDMVNISNTGKPAPLKDSYKCP